VFHALNTYPGIASTARTRHGRAHPLMRSWTILPIVAASLIPCRDLVADETAAIQSNARTTITKTTWRNVEAWSLTDGRSEAIVVPKLGGRIVAYGLKGGLNFIWSGPPGVEAKPKTQDWGGDKTYIGPHSAWETTLPTMWPPPSPDGAEHRAEVLPDGGLKTISPGWDGFGGAHLEREYRFGSNGDFVITHTIPKVPPSNTVPTAAVWVVSQTIPSDRVYVPLSAASPYKDHFVWWGYQEPKTKMGARLISPTLLAIDFVAGEKFKLGAHPPRPSLATVKGNLAFVQRADSQEGQYPEGVPGAGLSVEVYRHDALGEGAYIELELLSPLRRLDQGATLVTRWNIHSLPENWTDATIETLLTQPAS
jgi:hypothetical protein